jgi:hypothetical protein
MLLLVLPMVLLAGCAAQAARYQLATNAAGSVLWRLDTWTGEMDACGFESGSTPSKPVCTPFPGPAKK